MFDIMVVRDALRKSRELESNSDPNLLYEANEENSLISVLIHNIFGGEILKTRKRKGWYFYNRIDGLRIDFAGSGLFKSLRKRNFDDIPASLDETKGYFAWEDYSRFLLKFVRAFEEAVGLEDYRTGLSA